MAYLARWIEAEGYAPVVSNLEVRLSSYLVPQNNPPEGIPAQTKTYFPYDFGNKWPLLAAAELPLEAGEPEEGRTRIRALRLGLRIYQPSIIVPEKSDEAYKDSREAAKRITRAVWSNWHAKLIADTELESWCAVNLGAIEMGDESRVGNPFYLDRRGSRLWIHQTEVSLEL